jgi:hypothetical protein
MFTARAVTSTRVADERIDPAAMSPFAGLVSGITSVGLNAMAFVSAV